MCVCVCIVCVKKYVFFSKYTYFMIFPCISVNSVEYISFHILMFLDIENKKILNNM